MTTFKPRWSSTAQPAQPQNSAAPAQVGPGVEAAPAPLPAPPPPRPVPPAPPEPAPAPPPPRPRDTPPRPRPSPQAARPDLAALAQTRGHCGTCRHFTLDPAEGRYMGVCDLGWGAHDKYKRASREPVVIHEAARCMTDPFKRWALRAGAALREVQA